MTRKRQVGSSQLARISWGKILNSSLSVQRSTVNELLTPTRQKAVQILYSAHRFAVQSDDDLRQQSRFWGRTKGHLGP